MSRIGMKPIDIPSGVSVEIDDKNHVTVKGPKGTLEETMDKSITITEENNVIKVERHSEDKKHRALHGLTRTLIHNMVLGVTDGFSKKLEIVGVGYRAAKKGDTLVLTLGYSHPIEMKDPEGITTEVPNQLEIWVKGADKQQGGNYAAKIRSWREPEPYKGKGIKYAGEHIRRKEGKTGKK